MQKADSLTRCKDGKLIENQLYRCSPEQRRYMRR